MTAFPWWSLHLSHSLETVRRIYMFTTNAAGVCAVTSSAQLVQHLAFRGATWIRCSRILCSRILSNSIPGNDFTPRITRLYTISTTLAFSRLSARSRTEISPVVTQLQFATGKGLEDQATFINMTLNKLNKSCRSYLNKKFNNLFNARVWIERDLNRFEKMHCYERD